MKQEEIIENNKLIAEFIGIEYIEGDCNQKWRLTNSPIHKVTMSSHSVHLHFDVSWDWLMPVYNKLSLKHDIGWKITSKYINIYTHAGQPIGDFNGMFEINCPQNVMSDAYRAIVAFIKWYNKQNGK